MLRVRTALLFCLLLPSFFPKAAIANGIYATGSKVFTYAVARDWGGVVLQGNAEFYDEERQSISPEKLEIQLYPEADEKICLVFEKKCYEIDIAPEIAAPLAKWVLTGQTGAYTAFTPDNRITQTNGELQWDGLGGFAPSDLIQNSIPEILNFLDFDLFLNEIDDAQIKEYYNSLNGFDFTSDFDPYDLVEDSSYINTDTDTDLSAHLADTQVNMQALISRFFWNKYYGHEEIHINEVMEACDPEDIKTYNVSNCSDLRSLGNVFDPYSNNLSPGDHIAFYLVIGSTTDSIIENQENSTITNSENVLISLPEANSRRFRSYAWNRSDLPEFMHTRWNFQEDSTLQLEWEDTIGGGDGDFNDFRVNVSISDFSEYLYLEETTEIASTGEAVLSSDGTSTGVFKFSSNSKEPVHLNFEVVGKDSLYISEFGFFKVDDKYGSIKGLMPNNPDYLNTALGSDRHQVVISYDSLLEDIETYYPLQKDAISFVRAAAIFRGFVNSNPQELENFIHSVTY